MTRTIVQRARKVLLRRGRELLRPRNSRRSAQISAEPLAALSLSERDELGEIHKALERIERGIYGRCELCASAVEDARLELCAWQRYCTRCDAQAVGETADLDEPVLTDAHPQRE